MDWFEKKFSIIVVGALMFLLSISSTTVSCVSYLIYHFFKYSDIPLIIIVPCGIWGLVALIGLIISVWGLCCLAWDFFGWGNCSEEDE